MGKKTYADRPLTVNATNNNGYASFGFDTGLCRWSIMVMPKKLTTTDKLLFSEKGIELSFLSYRLALYIFRKLCDKYEIR